MPPKTTTVNSNNVSSDAQLLLVEWTTLSKQLKKLESDKKLIIEKLDTITSKLIDIDFSVIESSTTSDTKKPVKKTPKRPVKKPTMIASESDSDTLSEVSPQKSATNDSKTTKNTVTKGKKTNAKPPKSKPVMIPSNSDTDSDTD